MPYKPILSRIKPDEGKKRANALRAFNSHVEKLARGGRADTPLIARTRDVAKYPDMFRSFVQEASTDAGAIRVRAFASSLGRHLSGSAFPNTAEGRGDRADMEVHFTNHMVPVLERLAADPDQHEKVRQVAGEVLKAGNAAIEEAARD